MKVYRVRYEGAADHEQQAEWVGTKSAAEWLGRQAGGAATIEPHVLPTRKDDMIALLNKLAVR